MKRIIVGGFHQETNSFNPIKTGIETFKRGLLLSGEEQGQIETSRFSPLRGLVEVSLDAGAEVIPTALAFSQSGGMVEQAVVEKVLSGWLKTIQENKPVDGVFLAMHGATQSTEWDDCCGHMLEAVRDEIGEDVVLAITVDLHANITSRMMKNTDIICGYQTYPHLDMLQTGHRAGQLGLLRMNQKMNMLMSRVPILLSASAYSTDEGAFAELMDYAKAQQKAGAVRDFTLFQVQPWLDVSEIGSAVIAIDESVEKARAFVQDISKKQLTLRQKVKPRLFSMDSVMDIAKENTSGKPCILVDSADSPNAGATGDNVTVLARLLERNDNISALLAVEDKAAVELAFSVGIGQVADFYLGATKDPSRSPRIKVKGYVKSLHDGHFKLETKKLRGISGALGKTAVLKINTFDVVVCEAMAFTGDPQFFRGVGLEPLFYQLVCVKACTSFRASYKSLAHKIFETDTPGSATADLLSLPFKHIPRPFFPFDSLDDYEVEAPLVARQGCTRQN